MFGVKFWGVRGSIPVPGVETSKYGGNTATIQILTDIPDYQIIVDLGTGVRGLGNALLKDSSVKKPIKSHIFLSHTHWDHIMGLPFFAPIYMSATEMDIYGPVSFGNSLEQIVGGQMNYEHFPVNFSQLECITRYHELKEGSLDLPGGVKVSFIYVNHPILCLGYRFEYQGKAICTCFDHEPYRNLFADDPENCEEGEITAQMSNERIKNFFKNADILIHDAQYTEKEFPKFYGWGHSTFKYAIEQSLGCGVKQLLFFHHDPGRSDEKLDALKRMCDKYINNNNGKLHAMPAYEGLEIFL